MVDPQGIYPGIIVIRPPDSEPSQLPRVFLFVDRKCEECGYDRNRPTQPSGDLALESWKTDKCFWYWTYLCVGKDKTGRFEYDVRLYPTIHFQSRTTRTLGDFIVIQRGKFTVSKTVGDK